MKKNIILSGDSYKHGNFDQLPKCHLKGNGCTKCSFIESANKKIYFKLI